MRIAILGSTGATGRLVIAAALRRGHHVVALARRPDALGDLAHTDLDIRSVDVHDPATVAAGCRDADALISALGIRTSGLGTRAGERLDTLSAGAKAVAAAGPPRVAWMGSLGAGASRHRTGPLYDAILRRVLGDGFADKAIADTVIAGPHTTVFHPGMLTDGPPSGRARVVPLDAFGRRWRLLPPRVRRADVAEAMVTEVENPRHAGQTVAVF